MAKTPFFGRKKELNRLEELKKKRSASLVVIKGRRRIGKSRLAQEYGSSMKTYTFIGLPPSQEKKTAQQEREFFAHQFETNTGFRGIKSEDWADLFLNLSNFASNGRILIVFDEINWMGEKDPTFLGKLKSAWDLYFSKNPKLIMILSGSMSGWIDRNILSSTGFLGRISLDMTLEELPLSECCHFWAPYEKKIAPYEIFKVLSVTGGVPRYLEEINPKKTAEENLKNLCFTKEGYLFREFENIFSDLFSRRQGTYKKIIETLVKRKLSLNEIIENLGLGKSGVISDYLDDLVKIGYLARDYTWSIKTGKESKLSLYRLSDNYIRFYLKYIEPNQRKIERRLLSLPPSWDSIMGLQFENLVLNNREALIKIMNIPKEEIVYDNPYFQRGTKVRQGCQIDYLVQGKYNSLYPCEIKYSLNPVGKGVIKDMQKKIEALDLGAKKFSIRPVLIHVNGVEDSVLKSDYFVHIIDFKELL